MTRDDPDYVELIEETRDELNQTSRIKGRPLYMFEIEKIVDKHLKIYKRKKERKP